jgi:hypothetical protein
MPISAFFFIHRKKFFMPYTKKIANLPEKLFQGPYKLPTSHTYSFSLGQNSPTPDLSSFFASPLSQNRQAMLDFLFLTTG